MRTCRGANAHLRGGKCAPEGGWSLGETRVSTLSTFSPPFRGKGERGGEPAPSVSLRGAGSPNAANNTPQQNRRPGIIRESVREEVPQRGELAPVRGEPQQGEHVGELFGCHADTLRAGRHLGVTLTTTRARARGWRPLGNTRSAGAPMPLHARGDRLAKVSIGAPCAGAGFWFCKVGTPDTPARHTRACWGMLRVCHPVSGAGTPEKGTRPAIRAGARARGGKVNIGQQACAARARGARLAPDGKGASWQGISKNGRGWHGR